MCFEEGDKSQDKLMCNDGYRLFNVYSKVDT